MGLKCANAINSQKKSFFSLIRQLNKNKKQLSSTVLINYLVSNKRHKEIEHYYKFLPQSTLKLSNDIACSRYRIIKEKYNLAHWSSIKVKVSITLNT